MKHYRSFGKRPGWTAVRVVLLLAAFGLVIRYIFSPVLVDGISMVPTLDDGDILFVNKLAYRSKMPARGDVVVVDIRETQPEENGLPAKVVQEKLMKRVIGLPGEEIAIANGIVFIDGRPLDEPYVRLNSGWDMPPALLGENDFVVIGDNRAMRVWQHTFGIVPKDQITAKVVVPWKP